jgi:hypothetical protein
VKIEISIAIWMTRKNQVVQQGTSMTTNTDWHAAALHDLRHLSLSVDAIAKKYGVHRRTLDKIAAAHGVVREAPPLGRGPKRKENGQPISREHHSIGVRLNMARGGEGVRSYSKRLGVSTHVLTRMEVGQHDFQLSQLQKIAEVTGKSLSELMQSFEKNLYQGRVNVRN